MRGAFSSYNLHILFDILSEIPDALYIMHVSDKPLVLTLGDPNGLGPELACRLLGKKEGVAPGFTPQSPLLMLGAGSALRPHLERLGMRPFWEPIADPSNITSKKPGVYFHEPKGLEKYTPKLGIADEKGGLAAGVTLELAIHLCLEGAASGIVTLPLHKGMLQAAGFPFSGHTEFLARRSNLRDEDVCMHLCGDALRVSLVTTHPPLRSVPELVTKERVLRCLRLTSEFLDYILPEGRRRIAVCGLNPHAGENGAIGSEEIDVIIPALQQAKAEGIDAMGPFAADTTFHRAVTGEFDAVLAMYHDQGLGPLKLLHFHKAVNVTLGLPFVRTSVDHGTGFDLVGKDTADTGSLLAALHMARLMVNAVA